MKQLLLNLGFNPPNDASQGGLSVLDSNVISYPYNIYSTDGRFSPVRFSYIRVIRTGLHFEIFESDYPTIIGRSLSRVHQPMLKLFDRTKEFKKRNIKRTKDKIRRISSANFDDFSTRHLTLTFDKNLSNHDITDLRQCNKVFSLFICRMRKHYPNLKYVKVAEYQKRGAIHYHLITNLTYISSKKISSLWGYGFISVSKPTYNISGYLSKYITKSLEENTQNARLWSYSQNLVKPVIYYNNKAYYFKNIIKKRHLIPTFVYTYKKYYNNSVISCSEYNLVKSFSSP